MNKLSLYETLKRLYNSLSTKISDKAAASHNHTISDVTNLQTTLNGKAAKVSLVTISQYITSQVLSPNTLYVFTNRSSNLKLTLGSAISGIANEYHLFLTTGSTAPTITWPTGLSWNGGSAPIIAANKTYEVSIMNNIATYIEV